MEGINGTESVSGRVIEVVSESISTGCYSGLITIFYKGLK